MQTKRALLEANCWQGTIVTNPYQSGFTNALVSTQTGRSRRWKQCIAIALLMTGPLWVVMSEVQSQLLDARIINTKDLAPLVGNETGR